MDKKMLKEFTEFRKNKKFFMPKLVKKDNCTYFEGNLIENEKKKKTAEGETFVNAGYGFLGLARLLSNLYPWQFKFRGKTVASIEGIFQGIKYKDKKTQNLVLKYFGADAYYIRNCNNLDFWGNFQILYWQGKPMQRDSEEYQSFMDEIYVCAISNPMFVRALKATEGRYILHHIGNDNQKETVMTRYEFEERLNCIRDFVLAKKL